MVSKNSLSKRIIALLLTAVLMIVSFPLSGVMFAFAANDGCKAIELGDKKLYFYDVLTFEEIQKDGQNEYKITLKKDGDVTPTVYIGGVEANVASSDFDIQNPNDLGIVEMTVSKEWLVAQTDWIAVKCGSAEIPTNEPTVDVDIEAPTINDSDIVLSTTDWVKDKVTVTVNANDGGTGVAAYKLNNNAWQTANEFEITENGTYTVYAKDAVCNESAGTSFTVENIDKTGPKVILAIDPNTWTNSTVKIIATAKDDESGLAEKAYKFDNGDWNDLSEFEVKDSEEHTVTVRDKVGNETTQKIKADKYDDVKPIISGITVIGFGIENPKYISPYIKYKFIVNATDNNGILEYSKDGENWQEKNEFEIKGGGVYTFYAKDLAGNVSEVYELSLRTDSTPPEIKSITPDPSTSAPTNQEIKLNIDAVDTESGLHDKKPYRLDKNGEWTDKIVINDSEEHMIYVRDNTLGGDDANISGQKYQATNFCDKKPTIENVALSTDKWTNEEVTFTVEAKGTTNSAERYFKIAKYKMDDGEWQDSNVFTVNDCKEHKFSVKDEAGNESEITTKAATNYDANMPKLLDSNPVDSKPVAFEIENGTGIAKLLNKLTFGRFFNNSLKITVKAKDVATEESNASGIVKATFKFISAFKDKVFEFEAKSIGNKDEATIEFEVKDGDLPDNFKGTAEIVLLDAAGNENTIQVTTDNSDMGEISAGSDYSFMIENNKPESTEILAEPLDKDSGKSHGNIYNGNIEFTVGIQDIESGLNSAKITINGKECAVSEIIENEKKPCTLTGDDKVLLFKQDEADLDIHTLTFNTEGIEPTVIEIKNENGKVIETKHGYKVVVTVCDNAGNVTTKTKTVYKDTTAPVISGFDFTVSENGKETIFPEKNKETKLYEAVAATDYGFFFKETVTVKVKAQDVANTEKGEVASGVKAIVAYAKDINGNVYYVRNSGNYQLPITNEKCEEIFDKENCLIPVDGDNQISFNIPANFKGQIYAYAIDNVENKCVEVHPNGAVIENADKHKETSSIEIKMPEASYSQAYSNSFTDADENRQLDGVPAYDTAKNVPLYKGGFNVNVTVKDTYSGIKSVECVLKENGNDTPVDSYSSDKVNGWTVNKETIDKNLVTEVSKAIKIDGNHNDMVLEVILTDNAGNVSYDYVMFGIDKTNPDIAVAYDNNNGDVKSNNGNTYFNADRTATVTISERNFDPSKVVFTIANAEGNAPEAVRIDEINDSIESTDETQHTYKITYSGEGVYTFDVSCTDRADNANGKVKYGESVAPNAFVLDKTAPTISVSYDNNSAANGKFFNAHRTATIVVKEHNFDVNRVVINGTASLNGAAKAFPAAAWTSDGDVHTAIISYNEDADYTFSISMDDMAGNAITDASVSYGTSVAAKEFTVDTEIAKPVISNPTNGKPYQQEVPVSISSTDVNLENCVATLLKTGREKDENDSWKWVKDFRVDNVINLSNDGQTSSFSINDLFEHERLNDGIYTLKIDVADKAGNTQSETVTFTVNRFGSVYDYNQYTTETLNGKYVQAITDNIVITEYNPSPLSENAVISLTRDGAPVEIGDSNLMITPVYTESAAGASGWYEYKYEISKNVFSTVDAQGNMKYLDGIYKLYVASKDIANNDSENISAGADMSFSLDSTAPMIASITGLEKKTVNDVTKDVTFEIFDAIGLDTVEVTYVGVNGKTTETYNISDLLKSYDPATQAEKPDITKYDGSFTMGEGMNNIVRIVAKDLAGNVMDTGDPNVENSAINFDASVLAFNSMITVSTNPFVRWYSHTVFFWVSIAVIAVALGAGGYLVAVKLRKKEEKKTEDYKNSKKNNK